MVLFLLSFAFAAPVPECRPTEAERAQRIARWQRPLYREAALKAAAGGKLDLEVEDRFRLMTSDALYGRPGSVLARRNDQFLQEYARQLESLGLVIDTSEVEALRKHWLKVSGASGKVNWYPVKSFAKVMTGPELLRRCGNDLLEAKEFILRPEKGVPSVLICPGLLLKLGSYRFGPQVRPPVSDEVFGADAAAAPDASRDPLVVKLPTDELYGLLLDLFSRASAPALPPEKGQVLTHQALRKMLDRKKLKKPAQQDAWLRANRVFMCPDVALPRPTPPAPAPAPVAVAESPTPTETPLEPSGEVTPRPTQLYTPMAPTPTAVIEPAPVNTVR